MRKSNIEFLRIVAFLMVCSIHITGAALGYKESLLSHNYNWYYVIIMRTIVAPAVPVFVLISGYAFAHKGTFNFKKTMKNLLVPLACFIPLLFIVTIYVNGFSFKTGLIALKEFWTSQGAYYHLWYILLYIPLTMIMGYLNDSLSKIPKEVFKKLLILLIPLVTMHSTVTIFYSISSVFSYFSNMFIYFILLYLIGYYIAKFNVSINKLISLSTFILCIIINTFLFWTQNDSSTVVVNYAIFSNVLSIFMFLQALSLFMFFKGLEIKNIKISKFINTIASHTYGAYIVHIFYIFCLQFVLSYLLKTSSRFYFIYEIAFIFMVAVCAILTEALRKYIFSFKKKKIKKVLNA